MSRQDSQPPTGHSDEDDNARVQRIAAMRELAGADASSTVTPLSSLATKSPGQQNRRVPALLIALTVIVVVASMFAAWRGRFPWQRGKPTTVATTTSVNLADYDLQCPSAAVWSPDDKRIAVLAQLGACSNSDAGIIEPNVVALFNIHGKLERLLYPDNLALGKDAPTTPHPTPMAGAPLPTTEPTSTHYWAMGWSPDGVRLALVYETLFKRDQKGYSPFESGLILLPVDGSSGEKLSGLTNPTSDVWDLQARRQIRSDTTNQTPSFVYQWSSQAMLTPVANSVASGPIGSPSGGQRFTIWQPGGVFLIAINTPSFSLSPPWRGRRMDAISPHPLALAASLRQGPAASRRVAMARINWLLAILDSSAPPASSSRHPIRTPRICRLPGGEMAVCSRRGNQIC
jgi:hypothetical protein